MEFAKRHAGWSEEADKESLMSEVIACLEEAKKKLMLNVCGNVIYGEVDPEHLVEDLLSRFISLQFPDYFVVMESPRGTFVSGRGIAGVVKTSSKMSELVRKLEVSSEA